MAEDVVGSSKVVLGLVISDGKFLLIKRKNPHLHLEWAFPGGVVNAGETDEDAVVRELAEEVKLNVRVSKKLLERKHPNTYVQVAYFHCELEDKDQEPEIGEEYEISEIEWVPAEEVLERFTSDVHPVIQEFVKSFARANGKEAQSAANGNHER